MDWMQNWAQFPGFNLQQWKNTGRREITTVTVYLAEPRVCCWPFKTTNHFTGIPSKVNQHCSSIRLIQSHWWWLKRHAATSMDDIFHPTQTASLWPQHEASLKTLVIPGLFHVSEETARSGNRAVPINWTYGWGGRWAMVYGAFAVFNDGSSILT